MTPSAYRFRPRWWAVALALAACAAGVLLGNWQWQRAEERRALGARIDAAAAGPTLELAAGAKAGDLALRRVAARGEFDARYTVLLDNRMHRRRPGYHVVQAMRIAGSDAHVVVLRGWVAAGARRELLPPVVTPAGEQRIEGLAIERLPQFVEAATPAPDCRPGGAACVWQNLRLDRFGEWSGLALLPVLVEQRSAAADGLVRDWPRADAGHEKNEMYAMQWYSLAALAVVLLVVLSVRREKPPAG
jgi:cytochrome oxidase assembly protein ShyY1